MKALVALMLIVCTVSAQIPDPSDTNYWNITTAPTNPYPPRSSPPKLPYKGNIYEYTTNSISFYNDCTTNVTPLEIWWTDDLTQSNSWVFIGTATNKFYHNNPVGFYGLNVVGLEWIKTPPQ